MSATRAGVVGQTAKRIQPEDALPLLCRCNLVATEHYGFDRIRRFDLVASGLCRVPPALIESMQVSGNLLAARSHRGESRANARSANLRLFAGQVEIARVGWSGGAGAQHTVEHGPE